METKRLEKNKIKEEELLNQGEKSQHEHEGWEKRVSKKFQTKDIKKWKGSHPKSYYIKPTCHEKSTTVSRTNTDLDRHSKDKKKVNLRPNLKNLSHGVNLSRGSNIVGSTLICIRFFKILAGGELKPVLGGFEAWLKYIKFGHRAGYFRMG